jgi:hypothetical protein
MEVPFLVVISSCYSGYVGSTLLFSVLFGLLVVAALRVPFGAEFCCVLVGHHAHLHQPKSKVFWIIRFYRAVPKLHDVTVQ